WNPGQLQDLIYDSQPQPETPETKPETPETKPETPPIENSANTVFEAEQIEFSGRKKHIMNLDHNGDLELEEGTIAFTFNADDVRNTQGLLSKDASGYVGGGNHLSIMLEGDDLVLRFQDEDSDAYLSLENIETDKDYDVQTWFGDGVIGLAVNGELVATQDFDFGLDGNKQNLQLGGLGWASADEGDAVTKAFNGTMTDLVILDQMIPVSDFIL
ncbi:MAG: hypothetical protein AAGB04_22780, partial [Pseudomonadota bacterium]